MRNASARTVMQKGRRSPNTSVRWSRSFHAETNSKPACLHRHGAREKSGILNLNSPIFLTPSQELVELNKLTEKKSWDHRPFWEFFSKKPLFSIAIHAKHANCLVNISTVNRQEIWTTSSWDHLNMVSKKWDVYVQKSKWRSHLNVNGHTAWV